MPHRWLNPRGVDVFQMTKEAQRKCDECNKIFWFIDTPNRKEFICVYCFIKTVDTDRPMPEWLKDMIDRQDS